MVSLASKIPPSWMDGLAQAGFFADIAGERMLSKIPGFGIVFSLPVVGSLARFTIANGAEFLGRFHNQLKATYEGVQELKKKYGDGYQDDYGVEIVESPQTSHVPAPKFGDEDVKSTMPPLILSLSLYIAKWVIYLPVGYKPSFVPNTLT